MIIIEMHAIFAVCLRNYFLCIPAMSCKSWLVK